MKKIKKQRWLYSSQMVINFSKAIKNSFTSKLFNKFLSVKTVPNSVYENTSFDEDLEDSNLVNNLQFLVKYLITLILFQAVLIINLCVF